MDEFRACGETAGPRQGPIGSRRCCHSKPVRWLTRTRSRGRYISLRSTFSIPMARKVSMRNIDRELAAGRGPLAGRGRRPRASAGAGWGGSTSITCAATSGPSPPLPAMRGEGASRVSNRLMRSSYSPFYGTRHWALKPPAVPRLQLPDAEPVRRDETLAESGGYFAAGQMSRMCGSTFLPNSSSASISWSGCSEPGV